MKSVNWPGVQVGSFSAQTVEFSSASLASTKMLSCASTTKPDGLSPFTVVKVRTGQAVVIRVDAYPDQEFIGTVTSTLSAMRGVGSVVPAGGVAVAVFVTLPDEAVTVAVTEIS